MYWQIVCYNGTTWEAPHQMDLSEAINLFFKDCQLTQWDIKHINNLH